MIGSERKYVGGPRFQNPPNRLGQIMKMRSFLLLLTAVAAIGCGGDSTSPTHQTVGGSWSGASLGQNFTMALAENGGVVSGSGTVDQTATGIVALTITGVFNAPTATLTLASGLHPAFTLQGTVTGNTMAGVLNGSGFASQAITLTRQ